MNRKIFRLIWLVLVFWIMSFVIADTTFQSDQYRAMGQLFMGILIWWSGDAWIRSTIKRKLPLFRETTVLIVYTKKERFIHAFPPFLVCTFISITIHFFDGTSPIEAWVMSIIFFVIGFVLAWRRWRVVYAEIANDSTRSA